MSAGAAVLTFCPAGVAERCASTFGIQKPRVVVGTGPAELLPLECSRDPLKMLGQHHEVEHVPCGSVEGLARAAEKAIVAEDLSDTFYIYDFGEVQRLLDAWTHAMPRVSPFYAVKCNPEESMLQALNALGVGFDCASVQELEKALAMGVPQSRIIFANPCKRPADFRYAASKGVEYTTFDCASEVEKIAKGYPQFKCVLRIRCDDPDAHISLGTKYGAEAKDVPLLLQQAKSLGLQVVGVSFHVGSGCKNMGVYAEAIKFARDTFDQAIALGFEMTLLDIGGGFTAPYNEEMAKLFYDTAAVVNEAIEVHFPPESGVRIIAEPGRYFAETSATLFTCILGHRTSVCAQTGEDFMEYWLSDGTYGSFRIQVAVDGLEPNYHILRSPLLGPVTEQHERVLPCRLWGNSDSHSDCVHQRTQLPLLRDGDWLMFPNAGAYTICAAGNYGGMRMTEPEKLFIYSRSSGHSHMRVSGLEAE